MGAGVNRSETLRYAVLYHLEANDIFILGKKVYRFIKAVSDYVEYRNGTKLDVEVIVVFSYDKQKYEVLNLNDEKVGGAKCVIVREH